MRASLINAKSSELRRNWYKSAEGHVITCSVVTLALLHLHMASLGQPMSIPARVRSMATKVAGWHSGFGDSGAVSGARA